MKSILYLLIGCSVAINVEKVIEMGIKSDIIPEYYDSASGHSGPKKDMIPARY